MNVKVFIDKPIFEDEFIILSNDNKAFSVYIKIVREENGRVYYLFLGKRDGEYVYLMTVNMWDGEKFINYKKIEDYELSMELENFVNKKIREELGLNEKLIIDYPLFNMEER